MDILLDIAQIYSKINLLTFVERSLDLQIVGLWFEDIILQKFLFFIYSVVSTGAQIASNSLVSKFLKTIIAG